MGTPWPENQCAHRKRKIEKLIQDEARDTAGQILSEKPTGDHDGLEKLLEKRFTSFTEYLSHVSLCRCKDCECEVTQIPKRARLRYPISDLRSENYDEGCKKSAAEDRRGSYERRFGALGSDPHKLRSPSNQPATMETQHHSSSPASFETANGEPAPTQPTTADGAPPTQPTASDGTPISSKPFPSKTFSSDSESHSRSFPSMTISTPNTSSSPSSAASGREESWEESNEPVELKKLSCYFESLELEEESREESNELVELKKPSCDFESLELEGSFQIENFQSLTHLDISKCYSLDHIPKEISNLLQLEVFKGFVVGNSMEKEKDSCTLEDLAKLTRLRELSIDSIRREDFPVISELRDLNRLKKLHKLRIDWGGVPVHESENITKVDNSSEEMPAVLSDLCVPLSLLQVENDASPELPPQLEELHLKCLPRKSAPDWLRASKRNKIKNLHIEGGPLSDLGQLALQEKSEWQVEILRLMFLKGLEMNWTDLRKLFPKLIYFEKVGCPKLQFAPCDEQGVWMKKPNKFF